jgi:hypothetical protein
MRNGTFGLRNQHSFLKKDRHIRRRGKHPRAEAASIRQRLLIIAGSSPL